MITRLEEERRKHTGSILSLEENIADMEVQQSATEAR